MPDRRLVAVLTAVAAAAALTGCGGGDGAKPASGGSAAKTGDRITIVDFTFAPTPLKVKAGQQVTVTNQDSAPHTVTADDKAFDSKELKKGQTFTFTAPAKAGSYSYICDIHQYMKGSLEVS